MVDKEKQKERNKRGQAKRKERLDIEARTVGFDTWRKFETAIIRNEYQLKPRPAEIEGDK